MNRTGSQEGNQMTHADTLATLRAADLATFAALQNHWDACCKATAANCLDDHNLCEKGRALYRDFQAAQDLYFATLTPGDLGFTAETTNVEREEAAGVLSAGGVR
jgi:hypothetical protein